MKKSFKIIFLIFILIIVIINIYNFKTEAKLSYSDSIKNKLKNNLNSLNHLHNKEELEDYYIKHTHRHLLDIKKNMVDKNKLDNVQYNIMIEELKRRKRGVKGETGPQGPQGQIGFQGEKGDQGPAGNDGINSETFKYTILNDTWSVNCNQIDSFEFNIKKHKELINGKFWTEDPVYIDLETGKDIRKTIIISVVIFDENLENPVNCSGLYKLNITGTTKNLFIEYEKNSSKTEAEINLDCVSGLIKINTWPSINKTYRVIIEGKILF